jgi:HNH endonuclease
MDSFTKKSQQLGMQFDRADYALQRQLLFWMAKKLGLDICVRCGKPILTVKEFSIDHVLPWLDVNPALFWDIDGNVRFSHLSCNRKFVRHSLRARVGPPGTAWCGSCRDFHPTVEFTRNRSTRNGFHWCCRESRKTLQTGR